MSTYGYSKNTKTNSIASTLRSSAASLAPEENSIEYHKRLTPVQREALRRLGIFNVTDLLRYQPVRYIRYGDTSTIENIKPGELVTLYGTLKKVTIKKAWQSKINMTEATFSDGMLSIRLFWFNQPYIGKMYPENSLVMISGKAENKAGTISIANPNIEKINSIPESEDSLFSKKNGVSAEDNEKYGKLTPVYNETKNVTSKFIYETIRKIIASDYFKNKLIDPVPKYIKDELHLPDIRDAVLYTHFPTDEKLAGAAKKRFLFEEMFYVQLKIVQEKFLAADSLSYKIKEADLAEFFTLHKIKPTNAQNKVLIDMINDLRSGKPMQRLLEGDVGSGKTLVAAAIIYSVIKSKRDSKIAGQPLQAVYLAPTEILAMQQYETLIQLLAHTGISVGYLSGKQALKFPSKSDPEAYTSVSKPQLKKWVSGGEVSLLVGTHAVTKATVEFKDLALVIIDEQHRFGINTRKDLAHKKGDSRPEIPHLLSMTATPIPRTLALSIFGDLDLSIIDELPAGRKKIETFFKSEKDREKVYDNIIAEIEVGRQVYIVCTKIGMEPGKDNENKTASFAEDGGPEKKERRSVESEVENIQKYLIKKNKEHIVLAGLHSKIKNEDKEDIMSDFKNNKVQILIATSLVEVGVNVPNATIMIIENADRFGMSQLHQLRGRIGRGEHASKCILFSDTTNEVSTERLKNFCSTTNGFELAELDMNTRGIGSLLSRNQSGVSDLGMQALQNLKLVEATKKYATQIISKDINLRNFPELRNKIQSFDDVHME